MTQPPNDGEPDARRTASDVTSLGLFLVLAEELHFGRAGARLGLTTSRVSQALKQLERRVGGALFERTSRRVALTPLGVRLRDAARPAYLKLADAVAEARRSATGITGTVRVGTYAPGALGARFAAAIGDFETRHPEAQVHVVEVDVTVDVLRDLRRDFVDVLAMRLPLAQDDLTIGPVLTAEPRVVMVAADHPLAAQVSVCWEDLAPYPVTAHPNFPDELIDAFIPPRTPSGKVLQRRRVNSLTDAVMAVASGSLVHPTVGWFARSSPYPNVVTLPVADLPTSHTALVWRTSRDHEPAIRAIAAAAERLCSPKSPTRND